VKLAYDSSLDLADNIWSRFFNKDNQGFIDLILSYVETELMNQSLLILKEVTGNLAVLIVFSGDLVLRRETQSFYTTNTSLYHLQDSIRHCGAEKESRMGFQTIVNAVQIVLSIKRNNVG
jgi:hypothetical protein